MNVGRHWSAEFVAITAAVRALPFRRIMLDGEAVTHGLEGLPDFHRLMSRDGQSTAPLPPPPQGRVETRPFLRAWSQAPARASAWVCFR